MKRFKKSESPNMKDNTVNLNLTGGQADIKTYGWILVVIDCRFFESL